jgi:hypothetical protein
MVKVKVGEIRARALLDLGYIGNYIYSEFLVKAKLPIRKKSNPYRFFTFDDQPAAINDGRVMDETRPIRISIQNHEKTINFNVIETSSYDIVLRLL